jgi:elongation factor G
MNIEHDSRICNVGLVGPYLSGKTTLLESILALSGVIKRKGKVLEGNTVGDSTPEARDRQMTVEISVASTTYSDIQFNFIDCPGSIEFGQETYNALVGVDIAIIVCEPAIDRVLTLAPLFKFLDDWEIPHLIFINKMERFASGQQLLNDIEFGDLLCALKQVSSRPALAHQYPIIHDSELLGFIDLVSEQAYHYHADKIEPITFPIELAEIEKITRMAMLEELANFDDHLLEELLDEIEPSKAEIIQDLKMELGADLVVPVFVGAADRDWGVKPLLDALVREAPDANLTAQRRGLQLNDGVMAQVLKSFYTPQGGKMSLVRVWQGTILEGMTLNEFRSSGIYRLQGQQTQSLNMAQAGDIVAIGKLEKVTTGMTLSNRTLNRTLPTADLLPPVYAMAIVPAKRNDEVKLSGALHKICEEDPALHWEQHGDTHEVILWGQGEIHLQVTMDRLRRKYNLPMQTHLPQVSYRETISQSIDSIHGRYKHQSGGHGQFGDVYLSIQPLPRGEGFSFQETIVGGAVPKQYIPGVETGVRDYLGHGPLGFPVVDVAVTLTNGSYHSVDSSEQAFKTAARLAMTEGMQQCRPTLLEPIEAVQVSAPQEFTARVLQLISGHRGQILGYSTKAGWIDWDDVETYLPQAEMHNFIVELRSLTLGVGFFTWQHHHLQEVPEKILDTVLASRL